MKRFLWRWLPSLVWMGLIFVVSAQPTLPHAPQPWFDLVIKKTGHALAYGILAWLYLRVLSGRSQDAASLRVVSIGLTLVYALSDEYHQTFVSGRDGTLVDVAVDGVGASGAMLLEWWQKRRRARSQPASR